MWVDIDDVREELRNLKRQDRKGLGGETDVYLRATYIGILVGYKKVEQMLHEMEEIYRKQGLEHIRSLREEQK